MHRCILALRRSMKGLTSGARIGAAGSLAFGTSLTAHASLMMSGQAHVGATHPLDFQNIISASDDRSFKGQSLDAPVLSGGELATATAVIPSGALGEGAGSATASASAYVSYGYLRLTSSLSATRTGDFLQVDGYAGASASFSDTMIIDAPGLTGTTGSFSPIVHVITTGSATPSNDWGAGAGLGIRIESTSGLLEYSNTNLFEPGSEPPSPLGAVSFVYGQPITITMSAFVGVSGLLLQETNGLTSGHADANFPGSVRWMGLTGLPDTAVVTQGQIDWIQPASVPGAPIGALIAPAFVMLHKRRRVA